MPTTHTKLHVSCTTRSRIGSNEPIPIQVVHLAPYNEDAAVQHEPQEASTAIVHTPRRKIGLKKKLTPRKDVSATLARGTSSKAPADPSSPAANTRSKKQLLLEWTKVTPPCCTPREHLGFCAMNCWCNGPIIFCMIRTCSLWYLL